MTFCWKFFEELLPSFRKSIEICTLFFKNWLQFHKNKSNLEEEQVQRRKIMLLASKMLNSPPLLLSHTHILNKNFQLPFGRGGGHKCYEARYPGAWHGAPKQLSTLLITNVVYKINRRIKLLRKNEYCILFNTLQPISKSIKTNIYVNWKVHQLQHLQVHSSLGIRCTKNASKFTRHFYPPPSASSSSHAIV